MTRGERAIRELVRQVAEVAAPDRIILFGSHAEGRADADSDVDLLVLAETRVSPAHAALAIRKKIRWPHGLDLIVRRPSEFSRRVAQGDPFFSTVQRQGRVVYEKPRP